MYLLGDHCRLLFCHKITSNIIGEGEFKFWGVTALLALILYCPYAKSILLGASMHSTECLKVYFRGNTLIITIHSKFYTLNSPSPPPPPFSPFLLPFPLPPLLYVFIHCGDTTCWLIMEYRCNQYHPHLNICKQNIFKYENYLDLKQI